VVQAHADEETSRVYYLRRTAAGSWSPPELVSTGPQNRSSALAVGPDGGLDVVWQSAAASKGEILYRHRDVSGSWGPVENLSLPTGLAYSPAVASDPFGRPHVVWVQSIENRAQILYSRRENSWLPPVMINTDGGSPGEPTLVADGLGDIHVAWTDRVGDPNNFGVYNYEIFYGHLQPEPGAVFEVIRLTYDLAVSREPYLEATADGTVHLAWLDNRSEVSGNIFEVFYRRRLPGIGWNKDKRFTYGTTGHGRVALAAGAENTVNVVWEDYRHGNPEIYYRQITWETGWDPLATRLTSDLSPSERPSLVTTPDGGMVLLWTDALDSHNIRVFAKYGHVRGVPRGN
jgi:hypothetical protein